VVIPHIRTAQEAAAAVRVSHYGPGGRGYAGSSRAAGYTRTTMGDHLEASARRTTVIVQIEDAEALDAIDEIAAVEGVDALFVGRIDLAVSMGASPDDPQVVAAVEAICEAGRRHGRTVGMFLSRVEDLAAWRSKASLFLLQSDHGFLIAGAANLVRQARDHSR
jgi:2-keto-3-deoxy-L-rhamnonate aldolase RhmA